MSTPPPVRYNGYDKLYINGRWVTGPLFSRDTGA